MVVVLVTGVTGRLLLTILACNFGGVAEKRFHFQTTYNTRASLYGF